MHWHTQIRKHNFFVSCVEVKGLLKVGIFPFHYMYSGFKLKLTKLAASIFNSWPVYHGFKYWFLFLPIIIFFLQKYTLSIFGSGNKYFFHSFSPNSPTNPSTLSIKLMTSFFLHKLLHAYAYIYIYLHTCIFLCITCLVYRILLVCMFSELTIWKCTMSWCAFLEQDHLFYSKLSTVAYLAWHFQG